MKIICISDSYSKGYLTIGKIYNSSKELGSNYHIIFDNGREGYVSEYFFKVLSEVREEKLNKIFDEGNLY